MLLPAAVVPSSGSADPTGRWLAFVAHATTAGSSTRERLTLCVVELRANGGFRDLADLGSIRQLRAAPPVAWAPASHEGAPQWLAFVAPLPVGTSSGGGLFGPFGALRPSAPASGLFVAEVDAPDPSGRQARRLGTATGWSPRSGATAAPCWDWRATKAAGWLSARSTRPRARCVTWVPGLPAGTGQGSGLAAHWDPARGRVLLLTYPATSTTATSAPTPVQAWLVSFAASFQLTP